MANAADQVFYNGVIYTADYKNRICNTLATRGNRILFVGSRAQVQPYIGKNTQMIDLQGKMILPGLLDTHIHPPGLSLLELYEVQLFRASSLAGYLAEVQQFLDRNPSTKLVYGRGWSWNTLSGDELNKGPRKEYLDALFPHVPVVLRAHDGHTLWLNSKALAVNGITAETAAPPGGVIEIDPNSGELWGTLKETAMALVALPEYTLSQYKEALVAFQQKMHQFGITGIFCLASLPLATLFKAWGELLEEGKLGLRIRGAMTVSPYDDLNLQLEAANSMRKQYQAPSLQLSALKFFADGVVEGGTSYLLEPYSAQAGRGEAHYGEFLWQQDRLNQAFCLANQQGFQIHVHSTGDGATQHVLDALAYASDHVPSGDYRNTITHLQLVAEQDLHRFKELKVIASVQPYWQFKGPHWWHKVDYQLLGQRAEREFPLGSFFANQVVVTSSSDYPATLIPNPMLAIDIGVTRNMDQGQLYGVADIGDMDDERYLLNKSERANVEQMIRSFTINGAYAMFLEQEIGSIEAGKYADFVVLDQDLLQINPIYIDQVQVVMTVFDGNIVYTRSES